jgi:hypothetical protein
MIEKSNNPNTSDFSAPKQRPWSDNSKNSLDNNQRGLDYLNSKLEALEKRVENLSAPAKDKSQNHLPEKKQFDIETK